jgi:hypothetical protein
MYFPRSRIYVSAVGMSASDIGAFVAGLFAAAAGGLIFGGRWPLGLACLVTAFSLGVALWGWPSF